MSHSLKRILYHASLRGVRAQFVNSISTQRPLRSAADSLTRAGYCRWFSAALKTISCSAQPSSPLHKEQTYIAADSDVTRVRAELKMDSFLSSFSVCICWNTHIFLFVYFRYSRAMGSATPLIQAKMDDPSWWQWRVGWATAWSWCWISSRMNTCLYGERLVSSLGGYCTGNIPFPVLYTSAKTMRWMFLFAPQH